MPKSVSTRSAYKMLTCIYLCRTLLFFAPYADFFFEKLQYICKCKLIESIVTKYGKDNYCSTFNADFVNIVCTGFNVDCEG